MHAPASSNGIHLAYHGESMRGTFRPGDCLWIEPDGLDSLRIGDVVAFGGNGKKVVHRIVGRCPDGFVTRGDGALRPDGDALTSERFLGRVVAMDRAGRRHAVVHGRAGWFRSVGLHMRCRLRVWLLFPLAPLYRLMRSRRWLARFWRPRIVRLRLAYPRGTAIKYLHQGRTIAVWQPDPSHWWCRKPYDLVLEPPVP